MREISLYRTQSASLASQDGQRLYKSLGVGVLWPVQHLVFRPCFNNHSAVEHCQSVTQIPDNTYIVGNED